MRTRGTQHSDKGGNPLRALHEDACCSFELVGKRGRRGDRRNVLLDLIRVHAGLDGCMDNRGLVWEDAEDCAFSDVRSFGHLACGDGRSLLQQEGDDGLDDRLPTVVGRQGFCAFVSCGHGISIAE